VCRIFFSAVGNIVLAIGYPFGFFWRQRNRNFNHPWRTNYTGSRVQRNSGFGATLHSPGRQGQIRQCVFRYRTWRESLSHWSSWKNFPSIWCRRAGYLCPGLGARWRTVCRDQPWRKSVCRLERWQGQDFSRSGMPIHLVPDSNPWRDSLCGYGSGRKTL